MVRRNIEKPIPEQRRRRKPRLPGATVMTLLPPKSHPKSDRDGHSTSASPQTSRPGTQRRMARSTALR
ncbi:hypothetical protein TNCV_1834701 [Trichonephila clavipes]|nr:hypothetical protein TNCV_1834701 [Trichonephila clavipes]